MDQHIIAENCWKHTDREKADRLLLLGDILYHGPRNDLPKDYNPKEVIALLNQHKQDILCVRGNCDTEVDQMVLEFPVLADYCVIADDKNVIYATHGHHFNEGNLPPLQKGDILLNGHTHVPKCVDAAIRSMVERTLYKRKNIGTGNHSN